MKTIMKILRTFAFICVALLCCATTVSAQTTTTLTGTFKTPQAQTPAQAGLDAGQTIATIATYGTLEFTPWDSSAKKAVRMLNGAVTVGPQPVVCWIKSDGTIMDHAGTNSCTLVTTDGSTPTGVVYQLNGTLNGSRANFKSETTWTEYKAMPAGAQNWGNLAVAGISALTYSGYNSILDEAVALTGRTTVNFTGTGVSCVDNAGSTRTDCTITSGGGSGTMTTVREVDLTPNLTTATVLEFDQADGLVVTNPSGTIARVDLAAVPDSSLATISTTDKVSAGAINDGGVAATQALFSGAAGAAAFRAIADADVPNTITIDLATVATTANAGDSATTFFAAGTLEDARLSANVVLETSANTYGAFAQDFEGASVTRPFRRLAFASFPGTCTANREFLERSDPATAGQVVYVCNAAGTGWDLVGDGGAGGGVPSPGANGMVACTGTACSTSAARTITGSTNEIVVSNGDGVAGNPTLTVGSLVVQTDQANTYTTGAQDFEGASVTRPFRRLAFASFPGTCTANREFLERSDPATAGQVVYVCNAAGTGWDLVGDGTAGGANHNLLSATHTDTVPASPVLGDVPFGNATPAWDKLAGNTTTTKKFLRQTGNGSISAAPAWDTIVAGDVPNLENLNGTLDVASGGTGTTSTLTGLMRGSASAMTAAELSGAVSTSGSNATTLATKYLTFSRDITIDAPTTADTNKVQLYFGQAVTITRVACSVGAATSVTIQLDERAEATPNTAGTDVMTSALACTTTSGTTTSFTNATIALRVPLNLQITAVSGTPGSVRVHIEGTVD